MRSKTIKKQSKTPNSGYSDSLLFVREVRRLFFLLEKKSIPVAPRFPVHSSLFSNNGFQKLKPGTTKLIL